MAAAAAAVVARKLLLLRPSFSHLSLKNFSNRHCILSAATIFATPISSSACRSIRNCNDKRKKVKQQQQKKINKEAVAASVAVVKRRTRSDKEFDEEAVLRYGDSATHIPVMLGEVLDVFASLQLRSFVDCTLGAAGHSSAIIQAHPEMRLYVGMDVDPVAFDQGQALINTMLHSNSCGSTSELKAHTFLKNYRDIKHVLREVDETLLTPSINGILMDLGMSSMQVNNAERGFSVLSNGPLDMRMNPQASLKAEDILNSWPDNEVGRILRDYGEESNWYSLQNKIVKARQNGGLHSTGDLVHLIQSSTSRSKGGRQGWIKTATRVFQALRIAVNDELNTLKETLYACFDCLAPGGRLAVISFHSLEDRIVKQTFIDIINDNRGGIDIINDSRGGGDDEDDQKYEREFGVINDNNDDNKEAWIRRKIEGSNGTILTKRPITPSEEEERLNRRCRSAKLRVIQKL